MHHIFCFRCVLLSTESFRSGWGHVSGGVVPLCPTCKCQRLHIDVQQCCHLQNSSGKRSQALSVNWITLVYLLLFVIIHYYVAALVIIQLERSKWTISNRIETSCHHGVIKSMIYFVCVCVHCNRNLKQEVPTRNEDMIIAFCLVKFQLKTSV